MNKLDTRRMPVRETAWWIAPMVFLIAITVMGCGGGAPEAAPTAVQPIATPTFVQPTPAFTVEETKDLDYTAPLQDGVSAQKLDVYAPAEPGAWPVVVLVHPFGLTKEVVALPSIAKELAGRGAVVFVPNWRAYMIGEAVENDGLLFREGAEELVCATRFARARAGDYGGDPGRLTVVGYSTPGGAAIVAALAGDDSQRSWEEFASSRGGPPSQVGCLESESSADVDALVEYGGKYTNVEYLKEEAPELWELCSPFANIGKNPGLLIHLVHGERDQVTSVDKAAQFHQALVEAGYDATLTIVDAETQIPWSGPAREALIQAIMEAASR